MSWVVVVCGLVGAFTVTRYKWGFFIFGVLALLYIACVHVVFPYFTSLSILIFSIFSWLILAHARTSTFFAGPGLRSSYIGSAAFLSVVWLIYPIAWACSEGANIIGVCSRLQLLHEALTGVVLGISGEMIWYGILDLLAGPVFLFFFLHRLRGIDYGSLGLMSGKATDYYGGAYGARAGEKGPGYSGSGAPGVGLGHHDNGAGVGTGHHGAGLPTATGPSAATHTGTAPISGSRV